MVTEHKCSVSFEGEPGGSNGLPHSLSSLGGEPIREQLMKAAANWRQDLIGQPLRPYVLASPVDEFQRKAAGLLVDRVTSQYMTAN